MKTIGSYDYPTAASFNDALMIASEALNKYAGVIPNIEATKLLGYKFTDASHIPGLIYKRLDEACMFGLCTRTKGGLKTTELAKQALDPYNEHKAIAGKASAIRSIPIIARAFDAWNGIIPEANAFPAKLAELTDTDWTICRTHVGNLQKLFTEVFPILKSSNVLKESPASTSDRGEIGFLKETAMPQLAVTSDGGKTQLYGEVRTKVGTVVVTDSMTLEVARKLLDIIEAQLEPEKPEKKRSKADESKEGKQARPGQAE